MAKTLRFSLPDDQAIPCAGDTISFAVDGGRWLELGIVSETRWSSTGRLDVALRINPDLADVHFEDGSPEDKPTGTVLKVKWHDDALKGALSTLLDYRDHNVTQLDPNGRPVHVAIDALRAIVGSEGGRESQVTE